MPNCKLQPLFSKRWILLFGSNLILATQATGVGAAVSESTETRTRVLEEVTVTARRVEESLQDSPISIAAFSSQALEAIGASEAGDIAPYTPNLAMRKQSGSQDDFAMGIRGVANGEPALTVDQTVGVYIDGIYLARSTGLAFDIVDMQRIEVLRGPQGTLFGRNAIGGAINIVTESPRQDFAYRQQASFGNHGYQRHRATLDTGRHGGVAAKVSALFTEREGEVRGLYDGMRTGGTEGEGFRVALNWSPVDQFAADYSYDYYNRDSNATINQLSFVRDTVSSPDAPFYGGPYFAAARAGASDARLGTIAVKGTQKNDNRSRINAHALTLTWDVSPTLTLKSISSYRDWDKDQNVPMDYASFPADGATLIDAASGLPVAAGTLVPIFDTRRDSTQTQFTQELQLIGSVFDERLRYTTGLYYFEEEGDEINPQSFVVPTCLALGEPGCAARGTSLYLSQPNFGYDIDNRSWSAYGEISYTLIPDLDVAFGYRYTHDRKATSLTNTLDGSLQTVSDSQTWSNFNPSLTLSYRVNDAVNTYAKVATGYRSGGHNARATRVSDFLTPFDEENIVSYELGWKSDLADNTLRLNGAVYHMRYSDQQVAQFAAGTGGGASIISNAGKSVTTGIEVDATWLPTTGLMLMASYGLIDQNFKSFETGVVDPVSGFPLGFNADISDTASEIRYAPRHSGAVVAQYEMSPTSYGQLALRVDATYTGAITFHPQYDLYDKADGYTLVNARVTLADVPAGNNGSLSFALWGKNLNDKEHRDFGIDFSSLGYAINSYGPMRSYGIDVVYQFNR